MERKINKIYNTNCLELMDKFIEEGILFDSIITDPPYGMNFQSNRRVVKDKFAKIKNDNNLNWLDSFIDKSYSLLKNNTAFYIFCSWHNVDIFKQSIERKFNIKNILVWIKNNHGSGDLKAAYAPKHEFIIYANKGRCIFRDKRISDVLEYPKISSSKLLHPTEKNIDMLKLFINNSTDKEDLILDPFMGSGTTCLAAKNLQRNYIGIEIDEKYYNIAKNRLSKE